MCFLYASVVPHKIWHNTHICFLHSKTYSLQLISHALNTASSHVFQHFFTNIT